VNPEVFQKQPGKWTRVAKLLAPPDKSSKWVIAGIAVFLVILLGVVPPALRKMTADDLRGMPVLTARGQVIRLNISPTTEGGSSLYNAVSVEFDGKAAFYALPPTSRWAPKYHQPVEVKYRIGRATGRVHIEEVIPLPEEPPAGKK
jgi:hypothetical protein